VGSSLLTATRTLVVCLLMTALALPAAADRKRKKKERRQPAAQPAPPADDPAPPADDTPWGKGVSAEQKATAQRLLEEGNNLFLQSKHREALAKYQEAIAAWDHPAIRFNVVRALINLDKPVEAYANLEQALRYGAAPLEDAVFQEAQNYKKLLLAQIAVVEISCRQAGVKVTVDGNDFLACPGSKTTRLAPGSHAIVGTKKDFLTLTRDVVLLGGKTETIEVELISLADATVTERRWDSWKPWAVTGGGAAIAGLGVLLRLKAQSDMDQYGDEVTRQCGETGCAPGQLLQSTADLESRAKLENKIAVGTMVTGGALVAAGLTLVILNRPRPVIPEQPPASGPAVVPTVTADSIGVAISSRF
jgi:hypothetical protein